MPVGPSGEPLPYTTHVTLPPPGPSPAPVVTLPQGQNPGITGGPSGGPPQSMSGNEPSVPGPQPPFAWGPPGAVVPLPDGGQIIVPPQGFTPEQFNALSGVRAGNPVGGPFAQQVINQLVTEGVLVPGGGGPVYGVVDPPGGGPLPGPALYTQAPVTQEQNNQAFANGYRGMSTAQRWARYNAAQNPAPPVNDPAPAPVDPTPNPSFPYEPPPTWGGGGSPPFYPGGANQDEVNANQGPRPGTVIPRPRGPGQAAPGPKGGSPPFYPGPQPGGSPPFFPGGGGGKPADLKSQKKPPMQGPPFNPSPQAAHASALRTFLG